MYRKRVSKRNEDGARRSAGGPGHSVRIGVGKSASHHQSHSEIGSDKPCSRQLFQNCSETASIPWCSCGEVQDRRRPRLPSALIFRTGILIPYRRGEMRFFGFSDESVPSAGSLPHASEEISNICKLTELKSALSADTSNPRSVVQSVDTAFYG
jgi:hypothetical protein